MRLLLDTHAFLWFILNDAKLSLPALDAIREPQNQVLLSPASYWELAIKVGLGKYQIPDSLESFVESQLQKNQIDIVHIVPKHAGIVAELPNHHRDPFDRMLAAQAMAETLKVVSADAVFDAYGVVRLW